MYANKENRQHNSLHCSLPQHLIKGETVSCTVKRFSTEGCSHTNHEYCSIPFIALDIITGFCEDNSVLPYAMRDTANKSRTFSRRSTLLNSHKNHCNNWDTFRS